MHDQADVKSFFQILIEDLVIMGTEPIFLIHTSWIDQFMTVCSSTITAFHHLTLSSLGVKESLFRSTTIDQHHCEAWSRTSRTGWYRRHRVFVLKIHCRPLQPYTPRQNGTTRPFLCCCAIKHQSIDQSIDQSILAPCHELSFILLFCMYVCNFIWMLFIYLSWMALILI